MRVCNSNLKTLFFWGFLIRINIMSHPRFLIRAFSVLLFGCSGDLTDMTTEIVSDTSSSGKIDEDSSSSISSTTTLETSGGEDTSSSSGIIPDRIVFVTSKAFNPDQFEEYVPGDLNGIEGADLVCQSYAHSADIPNSENFRAWLSDGKNSPSTRFVHSTGRYVRTDGVVIAEDWEELTSGQIQAPINLTENGDLVGLPQDTSKGDVPVWTGTLEDGTSVEAKFTCKGWSEGTTYKARYGYSLETDLGWTNYLPGLGTCSGGGHLYCFEAI